MKDSEPSRELHTFLSSGIYRFEDSNVVFIDPVRVLNRSYDRFRVSPSSYYSRFFDSKSSVEEPPRISLNSKKRKRKAKLPYSLNVRELAANLRHQEARPLLVKAHESVLRASDLLLAMGKVRSKLLIVSEQLGKTGAEHDFVELAKVWQAHMYEITLNFDRCDNSTDIRGYPVVLPMEQTLIPLFNNLVVNEQIYDMEAEFLGRKYIIPRESCFYMSDITQIHKLIPAQLDNGFNLIVIDPPWENRSARQKSMYPTLPNRYFLSLPIKEITHTKGALVALWVTNREKLRNFVEKELFPKWEVQHIATYFWLKVKPDGTLISELDLFHHRPYECLLLGYCQGQGIDSTLTSKFGHIKDNLVIISVPGDYSRKPPIGELLSEYVPGPKPARCVELFAREMMAGWTCWGNEPLRFQDSTHFFRNQLSRASS